MELGKFLTELRGHLAWGEPKTATIEGTQHVLVPAGMALTPVLEKPGINAVPKRKTGGYALHEEADFSRFVGEHKQAGSRIFADISKEGEPKFVAVLNDHPLDAAGWGDFRATFGCPLSEDWQNWLAVHDVTVAENFKEWLSPAEFAEFVEDHVHNIVTPNAGLLIDIGRDVVVESSTEVVKVHQLDRGTVEVAYKENPGTPQSRDGKTKLPTTLELAMPVFRVPGEADPGKEQAGWIKIKGTIRFRVINQHLLLGVKLDRPELVLEKEFRDMAARIGTATGLAPLYGQAPAARA